MRHPRLFFLQKRLQAVGVLEYWKKRVFHQNSAFYSTSNTPTFHYSITPIGDLKNDQINDEGHIAVGLRKPILQGTTSF